MTYSPLPHGKWRLVVWGKTEPADSFPIVALGDGGDYPILDVVIHTGSLFKVVHMTDMDVEINGREYTEYTIEQEPA